MTDLRVPMRPAGLLILLCLSFARSASADPPTAAMTAAVAFLDDPALLPSQNVILAFRSSQSPAIPSGA